MKKTILALAAFLFLLIVPAAHATTYYLSPAPAGSDANDGSMFHPWRSPNHAMNCGDQILASPSNSYPASSFGSGKWGPVSGSGHCVAFLICATFDSCKINASGTAGIAVSASHWAVMGWEVTNSGNDYPCFEAYAEGSSTGVTDVLFANDIANGCYGSGFTIVSNGSVPADYVVAIADIVYNAAQEDSVCTSGFNFFTPTQADTATGTHLFISQSFSWANVDPNPCGGQVPTDGEGFILDTLDAYGYSQQVALENNISLFNGAAGFEAWASTQAPIFIQNNTSYGNSGALDRNASWCGEIVSLTSSNVVAEKNIAMTDAAIGCGSWPIYALFISGPIPANIIDSNGIYSAYGYYEGGSVPAWGPHNVLANPSFASPPGACRGHLIAQVTPA